MTIVVATRDPALEEQLRWALGDAGWACAPWSDAAAERASALILDARDPLPGAFDPALPLIALAPDGAPRALASGAARAARVVLRTPFTRTALENALRAALPARAPRSAPPLAIDARMRALCAQLDALAGTALSVVLAGETGTGKTHLARWLHSQSPRALAPLVELSAGSLAEQRLDGEPGDEPGPLERAHTGTLLVEDVAELPHGEQLALLRFLVERTSARGAALDVRVVATTRAGLAQERAAGRLDADLAARLAGVELTLPPLRERPLEIAAFAARFAERAARLAGGDRLALDPVALGTLRALPLLGNLHELESLVQRAALRAPGEALDFAALARPGAARRAPTPPAPRDETLDLRELERRAIERALALARGDRGAAARALGIHPRTLRNKLRAAARAAAEGRVVRDVARDVSA